MTIIGNAVFQFLTCLECHECRCENNNTVFEYLEAAYKDQYNLREAAYKTAFDSRLLVPEHTSIDKKPALHDLDYSTFS